MLMDDAQQNEASSNGNALHTADSSVSKPDNQGELL